MNTTLSGQTLPNRARRIRRKTKEVVIVRLEGCFYADGRRVSGLWEQVELTVVNGEQMAIITNGTEVLRVPQSCCESAMVR